MRAAFPALVLGVLGGLGLATAVLSSVRPPPTVAAALGLEDGPAMDARRSQAVASLTAACMHRLGLAWLPIVEPAPSIPDASLDPVAWADRWGFGISTEADRPTASPMPDGNLEALARASPSTRAAIVAAVHGTAASPGCAERANEEVYGLRTRALAPLRPALDQLRSAIDGDPASLAAVASWRACVAAVSGDLALDRATLPAALLDRAARRYQEVRSHRADLASAQRDERRTAGVVARCEVAFAAARSRIAARYEGPFVARHREQLEAIASAIRSTEAAWPSAPP